MSNHLERFFSPSIFDIALPFVAFLLVVIVPSFFALWVIYDVLFGKYGKQSH